MAVALSWVDAVAKLRFALPSTLWRGVATTEID
jgi:hypothetical protein